MHMAMRFGVVLLLHTLGCGGLMADDVLTDAAGSHDANADAHGQDAATECGHRSGDFSVSVGNSCMNFARWVTLREDGFTAWRNDPGGEVLWVCNSASYDGCLVSYADCSTPNGEPVDNTHCTPNTMALTWGASCFGAPIPAQVACGTSQWTCSTQPTLCATASDVLLSK